VIQSVKKKRVLHSLVFAAASLAASRAYATLYQDITANNATIDSSGDVVESGVTYQVEYKPTPPSSNIIGPWISTNGGFSSNDAFGYEIQASIGEDSSTDKVDTRVSHADDSSGLGFDAPKYLGFAVNIPQAGFSPPTVASEGVGLAGVQIAQWWQGSPYSPPLALDIMSGETNGMVNYALMVHNDTTGGNPSSVPVTIGTGTIAFDAWNTFVVMTDMDYNGAGQVELWQNGNLLINWTGAVGYNPSTIPYNPPTGLSDPNQKFDVFLGPYRPTQETQQEEFFDEARWANTYADAVPIPQAEVVLSSSSALTVPTDGDIGGSLSSGLSFSGGLLSVTSSFTSGRAITVASSGGTVNVAPGTTFGIGNSLTWSGGTLNVTNTGTMSIAQTSGTVSVSSGSVLNVAAGSQVVVGGSVDPFTDSINSSNHVAIVNNGTFTVAGVKSTIAGITGAGSLVIGNGTTANTLKLADNGGVSTVDSLSILGSSDLDIGNNAMIVDYGSGPDPIASIAAWIKNGFDRLSGPAIISSDMTTDDAVSGLSYGIGYADGADGVVAGLSSGEIEIMYTLLGDANLDGTVNGEDFSLFSHNLGQSGMMWDDGDFNFDGTVNGEDFSLFSHNLGQTASLADQAGVLDAANGISLANVPEPASAGALTMAMLGLFARRRRRGNQGQ
jgi:hypothetical protein